MQNKNKVVNLYDIQLFNSEGDRLKVNQVRIGKKRYIVEGVDSETGNWCKFIAIKIAEKLFLSEEETQIYVLDGEKREYLLQCLKNEFGEKLLFKDSRNTYEMSEVLGFIKNSEYLYIEYIDGKKIKSLRLTKDKIEAVESIEENGFLLVWHDKKIDLMGRKIGVRIIEDKFKY